MGHLRIATVSENDVRGVPCRTSSRVDACGRLELLCVTRRSVKVEKKGEYDNYVFYDRVMYPLTDQQERKTRKDYGTKRARPSTSTSSSSAFGQPSSSHHIDDDNDGNDEGTSRASTPSPTRFVNSLSNDIPQVFSNPPNINPNMEAFYTCQTEILNRQVQFRDEQRGGLRSTEKASRTC
ncbi:hypothetical protein Tco_0569626 [Tanacetum coccineum]